MQTLVTSRMLLTAIQMSFLGHMLQLCTACTPKQTGVLHLLGTWSTDTTLKETEQLKKTEWAQKCSSLVCAVRLGRPFIQPYVFCVKKGEFATLCCLLTRRRKDKGEETIFHSMTQPCGQPHSVNKMPLTKRPLDATTGTIGHMQSEFQRWCLIFRRD